MSRTYRDPRRARYFHRVRNEDDFERELYWTSRYGVVTYRHFLAFAKRDTKRFWLSVPSWYRRMKNRLHRAASQEAIRHYDPESGFIPQRKKGWGMDMWW